MKINVFRTKTFAYERIAMKIAILFSSFATINRMVKTYNKTLCFMPIE